MFSVLDEKNIRRNDIQIKKIQYILKESKKAKPLILIKLKCSIIHIIKL